MSHTYIKCADLLRCVRLVGVALQRIWLRAQQRLHPHILLQINGWHLRIEPTAIQSDMQAPGSGV